MIVKQIDTFKARISAAWSAPGVTRKELRKLALLKRASLLTFACLDADELQWLNALAMRGGWDTSEEANTFSYVVDEEPA